MKDESPARHASAGARACHRDVGAEVVDVSHASIVPSVETIRVPHAGEGCGLPREANRLCV